MGFLESGELKDATNRLNILTQYFYLAKFPELVKFVTENLEQLPEVVHK